MERRRLSDRLPFVAFLLILILCSPPSQAFATAEASSAPDAPSALAAACTEEDRYSETFETGWASDWYLASGFQIVSSGSGKALQGTGASSAIAASLLGRGTARAIAAYLRGDYWTDYSFSFDLQLNAGEFMASLRYNADSEKDHAFDRILGKAAERYYVTFTSTGVTLGRTRAGADSTMTSAATPLVANQWYAVKLVVQGGVVSVYVNDALVASGTDADPVPSGSIEFEAKTRAQALLDNVQVAAQVPCEYTWVRTKTYPVGGDINVITVDPKDSNVVYAGTEHMGLWKSTDSGQTWTEVGYSGDMGSLGKTTAIAVAPSNTSVVYAAWVEAVEKSTDGGAHWTRTDLLDTGVRVNALAVDPTNADIVYAGVGERATSSVDGIYKSTDGGDTWTKLGFSTGGFSLAIPALVPDTLYAGGRDGVYKSTDAGATWTRVYAGARSGQLRTGTTSGGFPGYVTSLIADELGTAIFSIADATIRSTDGGATWGSIRNTGDQLVMRPSNPKDLYLVDGASILKSTNGGDTWTSVSSWTVPASTLKTIAVDPQNQERLYAGTLGQGVFYSMDGAATWFAPTHAPIPANLGTGFGIDQRNGNLFVGTPMGEVYKSEDGGASWGPPVRLGTGSDPPSGITSITHDPQNDIVYLTSEDGIFKSEDGGWTWQAINGNLPNTGILVGERGPTPATLYVGIGGIGPDGVFGGQGVYHTGSTGANWTHADGVPNLAVPDIVASPSNRSILYAAVMGGGVVKSVNGGWGWSQVNTGLTNMCAYALAVHPTDPNVVWAGTWSDLCKERGTVPDGLYQTTNGGKSWLPIAGPEKHLVRGVKDIAIDPSDPNSVFVVCSQDWVFHSDNAGEAWRLANNGVSRHGAGLNPKVIRFDANGGTLYMTTGGLGPLRNDLKAPETGGSLRFR